MSQAKQPQSQSGRPPVEGSRPRSAQAGRTVPRTAKRRTGDRQQGRGGGQAGAGEESGWSVPKRSLVGFLLRFAVLIVAFHLLYAPFSETDTFRSYLTLHAEIAGVVLRTLGGDVSVDGQWLRSPAYATMVDHGCDGLEITAVFVCAVLASPVSVISRVSAALVGAVALAVINVVRIVSLFCIGGYSATVMHTMHWDVWPVMIIVLELFAWVAWARWAVRKRAGAA